MPTSSRLGALGRTRSRADRRGSKLRGRASLRLDPCQHRQQRSTARWHGEVQNPSRRHHRCADYLLGRRIDTREGKVRGRLLAHSSRTESNHRGYPRARARRWESLALGCPCLFDRGHRLTGHPARAAISLLKASAVLALAAPVIVAAQQSNPAPIALHMAACSVGCVVSLSAHFHRKSNPETAFIARARVQH